LHRSAIQAILAVAMKKNPVQELDAAAIRAKEKEFLWPSQAHYYQEPIVPVEASMRRVKDSTGREYLDFFGGILTVSVGHCHPKVNSALKAQIDRLGHVSTLYPTIPAVELAERLARITPGRLQKSYFLASGTEADETAVMVAQVFTGALEIIALRHGYSGRSMLAQSLDRALELPRRADADRGHQACPLALLLPLPAGPDVPELRREVRAGHQGADPHDHDRQDRRLPGRADPGRGRLRRAPPEYFKMAVEIVREHGGVFICDEVQTGFGRTGKHWFGIEHWGVEPELMTMAKGVANGMPLAVCIATPEIADAFKKSQISTFGGNPLSCAAANATLEVIEEEDWRATPRSRARASWTA
jgi:4-aminobutyrate aminotransferase-like enzyme